MATKERKILAEPEFLTREDTEGGRWTVDECRAVRGEPSTNIVEREMRVPTQDDALARCIRAHEMMHAKVSPAGDWKQWIDRKIASYDSLVATEELRVNLLCQKAGFDVKGNLTDGGEMADGERVAATKDWKGAVQFAVATAGTASNKAFLTGIRRHNREWGAILLDISKRAVREMEKAYKTGKLASTVVTSYGIAPFGFSNTERIAEWVDRLSETSPEELQRQKEEARRAREEARRKKGEGKDGEGEQGVHSNAVQPEKGTKGRDDGNPFKGITPDSNTFSLPTWAELNIRVLPMPVHSKGNIGKKRIASNYGLRPRRMHRYMTDPQMRIFDRTVKGTGGVVIIDGSGSMSFSRQQLTKILENAPGATVAVYTDQGENVPNMWVVAKKGRMVDTLPETGFGNGVDFPAIEWGHKQREKSNTPMIWVTDGGVCGRGNYSEMLAMQCINFAKKNGIVVVPHVNEAIDQLQKLKNGDKARSVWPPMFKQAYKNKMGMKLEG